MAPPEMAAEPSAADMAECPICGAAVPVNAPECPQCGEKFGEGAGAAEGAKVGGGFREKLLFYAGIALILLGGPGVALGSWLHDWLRIPIWGKAYEVFGPLNRLFAAAGLLVLIVGIVTLILSLRLTPADLEDYEVGAPAKEAAKGK